MSIIYKFQEEFFKRHEFDSDELNVFRKRFPKISISDNVPVAWIIVLDEFISKLGVLGLYKELESGVLKINQTLGFPVIGLPPSYFRNPKDYLPLINETCEKIQSIDKDLYAKFDLEELNKEYSKTTFMHKSPWLKDELERIN